MSISYFTSEQKSIRNVSIIGGGSAGFMAGIALKSKIPSLSVRIVRSKDIGIIGVGEGSTIPLVLFLHTYLKISPEKFYQIAQPTWKLGLKFLWGPRPYFNYTFGPQLDARSDPNQVKANGYYCDDCIEYTDLISSLMTEDRVFTLSNGQFTLHEHYSYHFENEKFVTYLENAARSLGVEIVEETVEQIVPGPLGVDHLIYRSGNQERADLFVDCSGFASIMLSRTLKEPFISFKPSLFCERAVVGGWNRTDSSDPADQIIKPYTTCETMESGWAWQIEHESRINRGYVYSPDFVSDEAAEAEFRRKNPRIQRTRVVKFVSGYHERAWVGNVVAIGNSSGFVEPLEATALGGIAKQCVSLTETLLNSDGYVKPGHINLFNRANALAWEAIRAFLAIHYKYNTRLDTPFWRHCWEKTVLAGAEPIVEHYRENGPNSFWGLPLLDGPQDQFRLSGYITMLVGMKVPYTQTWKPSEKESAKYDGLRRQMRDLAKSGITVRQAIDFVRSPNWRWKQQSMPSTPVV